MSPLQVLGVTRDALVYRESKSTVVIFEDGALD
jgi:hypothetical protein